MTGIYPADYSGKYRRFRSGVAAFLLLAFLLLPWLRIGGNPVLLLDIRRGVFSVLGIRFWFHDAPMLLFIFGGAATLLALVTSLWGRLWCGWGCPQTIYSEFVFRKIERWIDGNSLNRRKLAQAPWSLEKAAKRSLKWSLYLVVSAVLSHSFIAYFVGTEALAQMVKASPVQNPGAFFAVMLVIGAILFDLGWFREQFCTLLCPYGRFQSVLMDESSLAVAYQSSRGDCIDCKRCVQVCPTGIDIRNGLQMECIACTACIDACDTVMTKIGKPLGLIRYDSSRKSSWSRFGRPAAYSTLLIALMSGLVWSVSHRQPIELNLIRTVGAPYAEVLRENGKKEIINRFNLDVLNQSFETIEISIQPPASSDQEAIRLISPALPSQIEPGDSKRLPLFVQFPLSQTQDGHGKTSLDFTVRFVRRSSDSQPTQLFSKEVTLVAPLR